MSVGSKSGTATDCHKVADCGEESVNLGEVRECRGRKNIFVVDGPSRFARVKRDRHLVVNRLMKSLGQVVVCAPLRIHRSEVPELILLDRSADVSTNIRFRKTVSGGAGECKIFYSANKTLRGAVTKNVTVNVVTAALGNHVEDAAGRLSVFRAVSARLDFYLLDKLKGEICASASKSCVRNADSIQNVAILRSGRAGDRRITIVSSCIKYAGTRDRRADSVKFLHCPLGWEVGELVGGHIVAGGRLSNTQWRAGSDRHFSFKTGQLKLDVAR